MTIEIDRFLIIKFWAICEQFVKDAISVCSKFLPHKKQWVDWQWNEDVGSMGIRINVFQCKTLESYHWEDKETEWFPLHTYNNIVIKVRDA